MKNIKNKISILKVNCKKFYNQKNGSKDQALMLAFKEHRLKSEIQAKT
jgi:hypothetical protein